MKEFSSNAQENKIKKTASTSIPGVRESNAGDDFHILWAARRAIQLLNPHKKLCRLRMEGVSPTDEVGPSDREDYFLGVDLTEYYEGDNFATATTVVVSQLKYSTRHPTQAWTPSRLCTTKKRGQASVIQRLADIYKGFLLENPREEVIKKLHIRLVSNQPITDDLRSALTTAQGFLKSSAFLAPVQAASLIKQLSPPAQTVIRSLREKTKLTSGEFTDFLRVLDLDDCGQENRVFQRLRLIQELGPSVSNNPTATLRALCELVRSEAQPEKANSPGLTDYDVLASLEVSHKDNLFPATSYFQLPKLPVETKDAKALASTIVNTRGGQVVAHGNAGVGKTTTVQMLSQHLPEGSVVIVYDCFGGGSYLTPGEQRHTQSRAFLQLTNDLAIHCGTPFLVRLAREAADLQRDFRRAIEMAAKIVATTPEALLVLVVDAADNAVIASRHYSEDCFVPLVWQMSLPANCRLVMTCRSHRRASLQPPSDAIEYELKGFDDKASAAYLRQVFSNASEDHCRAFHSQTGGNPRMQFYRLDELEASEDSAVALDQLLSTSKRTPTQMFDDLLDAAVRHAPQPDKARQYLAALMCLSRPIPLTVFADACSISFTTASNFCRALMPGLILENDEVSFRDEDFETYLRDHLNPNELAAAHNHLGTYFLARADQDDYTARAVADHLFLAGQYSKMINLALDGPEPTVIPDELLRLQVSHRRISLAMQAACKLDSEEDAFRLTLLAAEAARSDGAFTALVRENPELAMLYGDANSVARIYLRDENQSWLGSAHLRIAAMYARDPAQRDQAPEHLHAAEAWLRRRALLSEHERYDWIIDAVDIACGAETVFWLSNARQAHRWLKRWRPISVVIEAMGHLVLSLASQITQEQQEQLLTELKLLPEAMAVLLGALWQAGTKPSRTLVDRTAKCLDRAIQRGKAQPEANLWFVAFCELSAWHGLDAKRILRLCKTLCPVFPDAIPYDHDDLSRYDLPLRAVCLQAALANQELTTADLLPEKYRQKEAQDEYRYDRYDSERRRFSEAIGKILEVYNVRAMAIVKQPGVADIEAGISNDLASHRTDSEHRWFKFDPRYARWAKRACEAILICSGNAEHLLVKIADLAERAVRGTAPSLWIDMAEILARQEAYRPLAYRLLERAAQYVMEKPFPGTDRWQLLLRCAAVARRYDEGLCQDYYKRSLAAAESIDDDSVLLLSLQSRLAHQVAPSLSGDERRTLAMRLARMVEAHEDHVSEASSLPWAATLGAVSRLDTASGLALCSRWDDENRFQIHNGIIPVVREITESGFLSPLEGLQLLRLAGERYDISNEALLILDQLRTKGISARPQLVQATQAISNWIRRDIRLAYRKEAATRIVDWADAYGLAQLAGIAELRTLLGFLNSFPSTKEADDIPTYRSDPDRKAAVQKLMDRARRGSFEDLETQLSEVGKHTFGSETLRDFLRTLGQAVPPSQRVEYLNTLTSLDSTRLYGNFIIEALRTCLTEWRGSIQIREWTPMGVGAFLERYLPSLLAYEYNALDNLQTILSLPNLSEVTRPSLVLPAVVKHLEVLGPRTFYNVVETLAASLPHPQLHQVLSWSLERTEVQMTKSRMTMLSPESSSLPEEPPIILAQFFFALFGHPDKRVRWRAVHAARAILHLPNKALLRELVQLSWSETAGAFRSTRLEFYWMSARTWLLLLLLRLADERPEDLREYAHTVAEHALNTDFPHAQIRELAKQTALHLAENVPSALSSTIVEQLKWVNVPLACLYPRKSSYESEREAPAEPKKKERCFDFDYLDTIRYWYPQVSRIFGCSTDEVIGHAERWVCDRWGRTNEDWWNDPYELSERYSWQQMHHSHGTIPKVEILHTYLDYHAMFCVAGEMIDKLPIAVETYEDAGCPWEEWLEGHINVSSDYWLADLRLPTPYRLDCWGQFPPIEKWLRRDDPAEYDGGLGFSEPEHNGEIVVLGHIEMGDSRRRGNIRIASALVTPNTARALLHALQTADPRDFRLPRYNYWPDEVEINEPDFELKAWLGHQNIEERLEEFDPLARHTYSFFETFSPDFIETMELSLVSARQEYRRSDGTVAAWLEIWSDGQETEPVTEAFSNGRRLWLRIDVLLEYLCRCERDLIIEVQIARNHDHREKDEKYDLGKSTIYLLRRDGTLETMDRHRKIG